MVPDIQNFLNQIALRAPGLVSVWLIGSRANDTAKISSDWDFIALGTSETLSFLRGTKDVHRADVDFLVVTDGDNFESAWGESEKGGSLKKWGWDQRDTGNSQYVQTKWVEAEDGATVRSTRVFAKRVWP